ncbi:sugar transferase [Ruminococcus flavefaciens]|uniref:Exopolysaccharide biosynthesis polyprenyl glycosylphosphotransferase n=1 Tax=Ruminococcus flavefaciens TaxID=1265 RepID=A0A1M7GJL1_RUMFL|nr:sugar transferase [Ruminococcus flavefaciens]SHM16325.1 exopolysaccharide biosynthesis polyprenyl glycosylphosphotransferase [Ruminococcus flavefaciens]
MNKNRDLYKRFVTFISAMFLLCIITGIFAFVWYRHYSEQIVLPYYRRGNWVLIAIYCLLVWLFFRAYGGFKLGYLKKTDMLYSQMISMICVNVVSYFVISLIGRRFMPVPPVVYMTCVDLGAIAIWTLLAGKIYFMMYPPRKLVIIYGSHQAASLVLKMSQRVDKYMICESISINEPEEKVKELIMKYEGAIVCDIPAEQRNDYLKFCFEHSKRAYIAPKISDIIIRGADDIRLFDTPLMLCRNYGLDFEQQLVKRIFDILFSLVALIPAAPFMLISAIAVKLYDRGPVFYKQKRLTLNGKEFYVYKFRSMIVDAEKDGKPRLASEEDDRITPVGKILRKFRIDEFPQLLNILKGDMSVVGPRPERPELTEEYKKEMPEFGFRLKVKAGLTGYAQVTGAYDTTPYDKLKMDLMYIENYSIRLDLQIILMTIKTMFFPPKNNAETAENLLMPKNITQKEDTK